MWGLAVTLLALTVPPAPTRWVTDSAGFLSSETRTGIDARLEAYEKRTGHQVVVWIGDTLGGAPLDEWAVKTFEASKTAFHPEMGRLNAARFASKLFGDRFLAYLEHCQKDYPSRFSPDKFQFHSL